MGVIRVLLAVSVLLAHVGPLPLTGNRLAGGHAAVQCFYVISGFYMALVLSAPGATRANFYFNRFLRLFPTYWALVAGWAILTVAYWGGPTIFESIVRSDVLHWDGKILMLMANVLLVGSDAMMFFFPDTDGLRFTIDFRAHEPKLFSFHTIQQAWTLPIEMAFYAMAPFVVQRPFRLAAIVVASLALRYVVYKTVSASDPWTYRFFPLEAAFFCAGALAFHVYRIIEARPASKAIGLAFFVVILAYLANFNRVPVLVADTALFSGRLIQFYGLMLLALPFVFRLTRDSRADRWLGELSYPFYLSHFFMIWAAPQLPRFSEVEVYNLAVNTLIVSVAVHVLVQMPVEWRFKRKAGQDAGPDAKLQPNAAPAT